MDIDPRLARWGIEKRRRHGRAVTKACAVLLLIAVVPRLAVAGSPDIQVEIRSDDPSTTLERVEERGNQVVCTVRCGRWLPREALYRISGDGIRASSPFQLPAEGRLATTVVQTRSLVRYGTGWFLTLSGGGASLVGGTILLSQWGANTPEQAAAMDYWRPRGQVLAFGGAVVLAAGIYLLATSAPRVRLETTY